MEKIAQKMKISAALEDGDTLTAMEALRRFGCFRLAARIADLRADGMDIQTRFVERKGKRVAEYSVW